MEREFTQRHGDLEGRRGEPRRRSTPTQTVVARSSRIVVGAAGDAAEHEADRIADRLADRNVGGFGGFSPPLPSLFDERHGTRIQASQRPEVGVAGGPVSGDVEQQLRRAAGGGEPLEPLTKRSMEDAFGTELADVRVHRNSVLAPRLGATAFTLGQDIHFAPGRYDPSSRSGRWLLSHELTHVVQQRGGASTVGRSTRIQRNGGLVSELDTYLAGVREQSDIMALRIRLLEWDGSLTEQIAKHFGVARFFQVVSTVGENAVLAIGTDAFLAADPADPYALPAIALDQRVAIATAWKLSIDQHAAGLAKAAASESVAGAKILGAATSVGVTVLQLAKAWLAQTSPTLAGAKSWLLAAGQTDRDTIATDTTAMASAKAVLGLDDYLGLLPILRVLAKPSPTIPDPWGSFDTQTLGPMVDSVIRAHLSAYVGGAVGAGRHVEGEMSVVGDEDWEKAFKRQWKKPELQKFITGANAFVDVNQPQRHIWIHKDRGGPGTSIHEGIHKYADPTLRDEIINRRKGGGADVCNLDEGMTELFTRKVIAAGSLGYARSSYVNQHRVVAKLDAKLGTTVLAKAYFDGDFPALKSAFASATGGSWDTFEADLEANKFTDAERML